MAIPGLALFASPVTASLKPPPMMVRIAEVEVEPGYLQDYLAILSKEAAASVRLEPGVVCIFPSPGEAQLHWWGAEKPKQRIPVITMRCPRCGMLESYASTA
jgi:hypothetical protein